MVSSLMSRSLFAVSWNLPCSTAMLITRIDGMVSYAFGRCRLSKTRAPTAYQNARALIILFENSCAARNYRQAKRREKGGGLLCLANPSPQPSPKVRGRLEDNAHG